MEYESYTYDEWHAEGIRRFGPDMLKWRFVCPVCGHIASAQDYLDAGAPEGAIGFSCIGRWLPNSPEAFGKKKGSPCNYAGGGLFRLNPVQIGDEHFFAFAEETVVEARSS